MAAELTAYRDRAALPASEPMRLARLLRLTDAHGRSDLAFADRIATGLPVKSALALGDILNQVRDKALYGVVSESTLRRAQKAKAPLAREHSERIYELGRVVDHAAKTFRGDLPAIARFLGRPNQALEGRTPFDVAKSSSAGAELVVRLLREADAGVAV
jgi:putative toxin-antitoxin system antitoxin component (TIGR02293 family)